MVEAGVRFEDEPPLTAPADEAGELVGSRDALSAAADLRAQPTGRDLVERHALEVDGLVLALAPLLDHGERAALLPRQLRETRRPPDEAAEYPRMLALAGAAILGERLGGRQARRGEQRRMVEELRQE